MSPALSLTRMEAKPMSQIPWMRMRNLCIQQGDMRAKLEEIITIATDLLATMPAAPKAARKEKSGRDRMDHGGLDRGEG